MPIEHHQSYPLARIAEMQEQLKRRAEQALKESADDPQKAASALIRLVAEDKAAQDHLLQLGAQELVRETLRNRGS